MLGRKMRQNILFRSEKLLRQKSWVELSNFTPAVGLWVADNQFFVPFAFHGLDKVGLTLAPDKAFAEFGLWYFVDAIVHENDIVFGFW